MKLIQLNRLVELVQRRFACIEDSSVKVQG
jgi:hypothetical protein